MTQSRFPLFITKSKVRSAGGHQKEFAVLPSHHRDVRVRGGLVFDFVVVPSIGLAATVTLGHLIVRHPQKVEAEEIFEPRLPLTNQKQS